MIFPFRREPVARQSRRKLTVYPGSQLKDFLRCARAMRNKKATSRCQWLGCGNQEWIRTIEPEDIGRLHHPPAYSSVTLRPDRYYPTSRAPD